MNLKIFEWTTVVSAGLFTGLLPSALSSVVQERPYALEIGSGIGIGSAFWITVLVFGLPRLRRRFR